MILLVNIQAHISPVVLLAFIRKDKMRDAFHDHVYLVVMFLESPLIWSTPSVFVFHILVFF